MKPFIKWAGGKRWLVKKDDFSLPKFSGTYVEPFLGGGAVFFHTQPKKSILSDVNPKLIGVYKAVRSDWESVTEHLAEMEKKHSKEYYYQERGCTRLTDAEKAAQFLYLNRTCWNGLYRENLKGEFNVPIGTKTKVIFEDEDFSEISKILKNAELNTCDFEETIDRAGEGDLVFADPPYTTAHNMNGFVKYNQKIFSWSDQLRLKNAIERAIGRGATVVLTNADHESIHKLYEGISKHESVERASVISGKKQFRTKTTEAIYVFQ